MAKICYTAKKFGPERLRLIELANAIILEERARDVLGAIHDRWNEVYKAMQEPPREP